MRLDLVEPRNSAGAEEYYREALIRSRAAGDEIGTCQILNNFGEHKRREAMLVEAEMYLLEALEVAERYDDVEGIAMLTHGLGDVARDAGDIERAISLYEKSLGQSPMTRAGRFTACYCLAGLAVAHAALGEARSAGRFWGAFEALLQASQRQRSLLLADLTAYKQTLLDLPQSEFEAGLAEGRALEATGLDEQTLTAVPSDPPESGTFVVIRPSSGLPR